MTGCLKKAIKTILPGTISVDNAVAVDEKPTLIGISASRDGLKTVDSKSAPDRMPEASA